MDHIWPLKRPEIKFLVCCLTSGVQLPVINMISSLHLKQGFHLSVLNNFDPGAVKWRRLPKNELLSAPRYRLQVCHFS